MIKSLLLFGAVGFWAVAAVPTANAQDHRVPLRSFDRFELDPENADGLWVEAGATTLHGVSVSGGASGTADFVTTGLRLAYGGKYGEIGGFLPYRFLSYDAGIFSGDEDGIGDLQLYGRWTPLHNDWVDAGLGLELQLPTGDENRGLGTGKVGLLPFASAGLHLGPADLRAHFGYNTYVGADQVYGETIPPDSYLYGGGLWIPFAGVVAARAELLAESFDLRPTIHTLAFEPGIDVMFPLDSLDLILRPTAGIGITSDSPDWSFGGSIALAWHG
ncbi:MAG: hypothetical protein HY270_04835 [Deltaproteobacteria bacterium]|nr:hypothetical protein [Deltaproteobacteria bacterium]